MSRESQLDEIMKNLIHILVHEGSWTEEQKRDYENAVMERSYRLSAGRYYETRYRRLYC